MSEMEALNYRVYRILEDVWEQHRPAPPPKAMMEDMTHAMQRELKDAYIHGYNRGRGEKHNE